MQKILAAFDRSETGETICDQALQLARAFGAQLLLLHVLSSDEEGSPSLPISLASQLYPSLDDAPLRQYLADWQRFEQEGRRLLEARAAQAGAAGVAVETRQLSGNPGRVICQTAADWGADLIVIGRRGRSSLREALLGSVSQYVIHHAPCAVQIVAGEGSKN